MPATPVFTQPEVCIITGQAIDDCGRVAFISYGFTLIPPPTPPVANDDNAATYNTIPLSLNALNNDTDINENIDPSSFTPTSPLVVTGGTFTDNGYDQYEIKSKINWVMTAKSQLLFLGGWVERKNASFSARDFSGINARLSYNWQPTGKISLMLTGWRESSAAQNLTASFSLNTGISAVPTWDLTEKIRIEGNFSYETRKFNSFSRLIDGFAIGSNNTFRTVSTKLTYTPYSGIQVSASAYHNDLISNSSLGGFSANGANINLRYTFGNP